MEKKRRAPQTTITQFFSPPGPLTKRPKATTGYVGREQIPAASSEEVVPVGLRSTLEATTVGPAAEIDAPYPTVDEPAAGVDVPTEGPDDVDTPNERCPPEVDLPVNADAGVEHFPSEYYDDVGLFQRSQIRNDEKMKLMQNHFRPNKKFKYPVRQDKGKNLKFNSSWLEDFPWLVYSKAKNGGYCLPCVLFARKPVGRGCEFGVLIERPFTQFRKALGRKEGVLNCHETAHHHKQAVAAYTDIKQMEENPEDRVDVQLARLREKQYDGNKAALGSIIDCIIHLGRQGLALRGHRDNSTTVDPDINKGNLQSLIEFRARTDEVLKTFLQTCPKNATYVSNNIQNEILDILGDIIRESITENISGERCPFFSIIADELTDDIANKHILSLCIRYLEYLDGDVNIREGLLDFSYIERGTAAHLVKEIRSKLLECGLEPSNVRGQSYDTTSAMSSDKQGVQGLFRKEVPRAVYTPCNSHKLNLVIASASKLPQIRNCVTAVNEAHLFLSASHKRQGFFEKVMLILHSRDEGQHSRQQKLKGLCKTRWVERFEAFDNFIDMVPLVMTTCDIIVNPHLYQQDVEIRAVIDENWKWDGETKARAQGILGNFGQFDSLVSLVTLRNVLAPLREITLKLQQRDLGIRSAYTLVSSVQADLEKMRAEVDDRFDAWYSEIQQLAEKLGTEVGMRRAAVASRYRATQPADNPKEYFKRAIVIPFIDDVNTQMADRFADQSVAVVRGFTSLLPAVIAKMEIRDIPAIVEALSEYEPDIIRLESLRTELEIWRGRWLDHDNPPDSLITALRSCSKDLLPNLHTLLQIGCVIPVTSCEAERSFSAVRRIKSRLRSTMVEGRLSDLVLLTTYRRINIDTEDVVRRFITKKPRRLFSKLYDIE